VVQIGETAIVVGKGIIWIEPDRLGIICKRLFEVTFTLVRNSSISVGKGIIWIESDRLVVICKRLVEFTMVEISVSAAVVGNGIIWVEWTITCFFIVLN